MVIDTTVAVSAEGTKADAGKRPSGECDGRQRALEGIKTFPTILKASFSRPF